MTDAFKTLMGARIVPRYHEGDPIPEDAFELPSGSPVEIVPTDDDRYIAQSLRHAGEMLADWVTTAKEAGLTVDITWDRENDRPFITIVREF